MTRTHLRPWHRRIWVLVSPHAPGVRHEAPILATWHDESTAAPTSTTRTMTIRRRGARTPGRYCVVTERHRDGSAHERMGRSAHRSTPLDRFPDSPPPGRAGDVPAVRPTVA